MSYKIVDHYWLLVVFSLAFLIVLNTSVSLNNNKKGTSVLCFEDLWRISLILERACIVIVYTSNDLCCRIMLLSFVFFKEKKKKKWRRTWPPCGENDLSLKCTVCLHFISNLSFVRIGWYLPAGYRDNWCFLEPS